MRISAFKRILMRRRPLVDEKTESARELLCIGGRCGEFKFRSPLQTFFPPSKNPARFDDF
jgi:hypothetical protein